MHLFIYMKKIQTYDMRCLWQNVELHFQFNAFPMVSGEDKCIECKYYHRSSNNLGLKQVLLLDLKGRNEKN